MVETAPPHGVPAPEPKLIIAAVDAKASPATTETSGTVTAAEILNSVLPSASPVDPLDEAWIKTEDANRELRKPLAYWAIGISSAQLLVMNICLVGIGLGKLTFDSELFHWYMAETFGALLGVALVVFRYLFRQTPARQQKR